MLHNLKSYLSSEPARKFVTFIEMDFGHREHSNNRCYFHPKEAIVGVCPLCLNERLFVLAAKQGIASSATTRSSSSSHGHSRIYSSKLRQPIKLPKIFALGSLLSFPHSKPNHSLDLDASPSPEDSFISIKFEENGAASWEKGKVSKVSLEHCSVSWNNTTKQPNTNKEAHNTTKSVIEHAKSRAPLRWRNRIGHLFQLVRWKRSTKPTTVGTKVEGVKITRKSWIGALTKRTRE